MKKELVQDWMTTEVVTVTAGTSLPRANQIMTKEEIRRLPVVDDEGRLIGIVSRGDVRGALPSPASPLSIWEMNYLITKITVGEIMAKDPISIGPDSTIGEAARTMLENRVSGLPVVDGENKLRGIITESDIFSMVVLHEWGPDGDA